jgi:ABC-type Fe3+-hydroxamate transport system substrate-binding protein
VDQILSSTQKVADLLGAAEVGAALTKDLERHLAELQQRIAALPPKRVLFVVWTEPLMSIGKDTFLADALRHAGAVSIVDSTQSWPQVNLEEVVKLQPDFLVFAESHSQTGMRELETLAELPGWRILDAVRNHRVAVISDAVNRPAPRIASAIEDLARQLHPEAFAKGLQINKDVSPAPLSTPPPAKQREPAPPPPLDLVDDFSLPQRCACAH